MAPSGAIFHFKTNNMKKYIVLCFLLAIIGKSYAQEVKVVFDVTSGDEKIHQSTMRHVKMMSNAYPDSEFEVVVYSGALNMMLKDKSSVRKEVEDILKNENITMNVCAMTLKRREMTQSDLISGVGQVPDGILEIVDKQSKGWGYIKEAN